jgi:spermidine synthase
MTDSNIEFLGYDESPIGTLILRRRALLSKPGTVVTEIMLDHELLMSSYVTDSERALSRVACELHTGQQLRVLVGGLGLGYTAWEVLQSSRVAEVEVVEFAPAVIGWMQDGLLPLSSLLAADPRVSIVEGDVYARLALPPAPADPLFDLILIDVDHSPVEKLDEARNDDFYTAPGLRVAHRHLAPDGVLGVWSYAESSPFTKALREVFSEVRVERVTFTNDLIDEEATDWIFFARGERAPSREAR